MSISILTSFIAFVVVAVGVCVLGSFLQTRRGQRRRTEQERLRTWVDDAEPDKTETPGLLKTVATRLQEVVLKIGSAQKNPVDQIRLYLLRAGFFHKMAGQTFVGMRWLATIALLCGATLLALWLDPYVHPLLAGKVAPSGAIGTWSRLACWILAGGFLGLCGPRFWLSFQVKRRQSMLRNGFPDALDMIALCVEGGTTFGAAIQRVTDELAPIHPELSLEMGIVLRQMQLGLSAADALRKFADRCDLADVRDLALVLLQAERYGSGLTKTLRGFIETARYDRRQEMEEKAQRASVKILFPTLLCIFPAIFIVILGPAAYQMAKMFTR